MLLSSNRFLSKVVKLEGLKVVRLEGLNIVRFLEKRANDQWFYSFFWGPWSMVYCLWPDCRKYLLAIQL
jgi:hypothetical protein